MCCHEPCHANNPLPSPPLHLAFKGQYHMFYGDRVEDIDDGLPKYLGKQGDRPVDTKGNRLPEEQNAKKQKDKEHEKEREEKEEEETEGKGNRKGEGQGGERENKKQKKK